MSYTALYRKWRPDRFEDVKGQDAIVESVMHICSAAQGEPVRQPWPR